MLRMSAPLVVKMVTHFPLNSNKTSLRLFASTSVCLRLLKGTHFQEKGGLAKGIYVGLEYFSKIP